jgi:hypothetical protein
MRCRETNVRGLAPLLKQLMGPKNARWVSVHEVVVRLSSGKRVPCWRLQEIS